MSLTRKTLGKMPQRLKSSFFRSLVNLPAGSSFAKKFLSIDVLNTFLPYSLL